MRALAVLIWKHGVVRIRKFIHTAVDLLSPIIFFAIVFAFKDEINVVPKSVMMDQTHSNTEIIPLTGDIMIDNLKTVLYYPKSPATDSLMSEVGKKLRLEKLDEFPENSLPNGYYGYTEESQLVSLSKRMSNIDAVIIFENMTGDTLPAQLNYTIRMKHDFHTEGYESIDGIPGPHRMFGNDYLAFMRVQWAVDSSYIEQQSQKPIDQAVSVQEFPYYMTHKNQIMQIICQLLQFICFISLLLTFVFLMSRMLEERASGIQELIKMVGVSLNTLGLSHFLNVLPTGLVFSITGAILLKITSNPLLPNSNGFLIFLMLLLYFTTIVAMAFVCSYIITSTEYATTVAVLSYGVLFTPANLLMQYHLPYIVTILTGFLPHVPMLWFWNNASILEIYGSGVTFSTMFKSTYRNGSVFLSLIYLLLQAVLYFGLAWYLSLVRPGKYGQALPWNFIFQKRKRDGNKKDVSEINNQSDSGTRLSQVSPSSYETSDCNRKASSCKGRVEPGDDNALDELINEEYFEEPPQDMNVGIRVEGVTKDYPKQRALKEVSLKAYKGEITVLVGHNGAGKTTLMSIITGMASATQGKVFVNEFDSLEQKDEVRKLIGLCPQHNMFFPDLNLQEHIMFFTMLKRGTHAEATHSSQKLAQQLGVDDKLNDLCCTLSGGMKRRAQLACALAGEAEVLVLDEPTSGLDVETRRELWDLLLSLRRERTVLLSTHFMEEADALGDRVAALHGGELRCFATTMHLKKAIGNGYRLSLTTVGLPKESAITQEVITHVPDATVKEKTINSISYNLPATSNNLFPNLFSALENSKPDLGIDSIGVGVSTLEEVFLKLCSDVDTAVMENGLENTAPEPTQHKVTGFLLYWRQLIVLLKRHFRFAFYKKWTFLILQVVLPITLICLLTQALNNSLITENVGRLLKLDMNMYTNRYAKALYNLQQDDVIRSFNKQYPDIYFEKVDDVAQTIYNIGKRDMVSYNEYISGVEVNETQAKVLFTTTVRHAAPVTLNMLSNLLAMRYLKSSKGPITTNVHPIEGYVRHIEVKAQPKNLTVAVFWVIAITFLIQTTNLHCVSLPCRERETGSRHIHIMSGCPAELHWMATLLFHITLTTVFLIVPGVIAAYTLDKDSTINDPSFLLCFAVVMFVGSLALYAFMYLVSFSFSERNTNLILVACLFIFGLVCPIIKAIYDLLDTGGETNYGVMYVILLICSYMAPPYAMITSMFQSVILARLNTFCDLSRDQCPRLFINEMGWNMNADTAKCCAGEQPKCYFCMNDSSPMFYILILIAQFIVLMTMVFMTERGLFNGMFDRLKNITYKRPQTLDGDQMVRAERTYVEKEITKPPFDIKKDSMLVDDIHKNYAAIFKKSCNAVKGVSFSVKKGECFGLLGVNGAGKSTTFKMLTADECTTRGRIFGNGYHLRTGTSKYLQTLGYCPQFFGLDMFQTGEENLELVLTLRGFNEEQVKKEVHAWIEVVGLEKYARRKVEAYSGGCIRRLGTAAALCGGSDLTLLDEPSAGVDVAARRRLWTALRKALKQQRSIVITSHSMDEMETLCSRIAIMCEGRIRALGSPAALRAAHAAGHAVVFKVKHGSYGDQVDGAKDSVNLLKGKLREKFNCNLKDEHKTMLHYHINETMRYSELFAALESLRNEFPNIIEDYSVTETTLEEVFLSFAKENKEGHIEV